jgi:hypothetical protein
LGFLIHPLQGELAVGGIQIFIILDIFPFIFTAISNTPFPSILSFSRIPSFSVVSDHHRDPVASQLRSLIVEARVPYQPTLVGYVLNHVRNPHVKRKPYSGQLDIMDWGSTE